MEESWKGKTRPNTSQWWKALVSHGGEAEAFLRTSVLGHGEKDKSRRKYASKSSSDDRSKLRQFITQPRTGRWGSLLFLFAAIGMLAFISQNTSLSQHVDKELERAILAKDQRGMELTLNRKVKFAETSHLIYEEGQPEVRQENEDKWPQKSVRMSSLRRRAASGTLRVGLLNFKPTTDIGKWKFLAGKNPTTVPFERVAKTVNWAHLFPEWIDDEAKFGTPRCPVFPMPKVPPVPYVRPAVHLDVVIARAPCAESSALQEGWRHPATLQVLLGAANLAAESGSESIYVLILSKCRPLINLFSCGELLEHRDEGWLYEMNVEQLKQRTSLPIGSCQLSLPLIKFYVPDGVGPSTSQREAYATILHSGAEFVCGAIAVAQSIRSTGSTRDLVVLVDRSILPEHRKDLEEAGWQVRDYEKISSSGTQKDFSKFRLWQLDYDKVVYLDADVIVLRNIDHLFKLPEVSASGTTQSLFNAGVMVIEPSHCTFQVLMDEMEKLVSEVKDDWEFFNRMFPWWHRIPANMNALKYFWTRRQKDVDYMNGMFSANPPQLYIIHYISGQKPWKCFRDYDCNWNGNQHYASNEAHAQWFKVYDQMPENLKQYCALSTRAKEALENDRRVAAKAHLPDRHWAINITDPRLNVCQGNHCDPQVCQQNHCDWNVMLKSVHLTVNSSITANATNTVVAAMK